MCKGLLNTFKFKEETHSTVKQKKFLPLYAEHLYFVIKCVGWTVTKIYANYTFEQPKFNKDMVIMNQVSCQNVKSSVEKHANEQCKM